MESFEERAKLYKSESERFQNYLKNLPDSEWSRQSACDEWTVADVVAHLVGNSEFYAGTVARGLQGESSPPEGRPEAGTGHPSLSAATLAKSSIAARERLGDKLLETYLEKDRSRVRRHDDRLHDLRLSGRIFPRARRDDSELSEQAMELPAARKRQNEQHQR